ncbi:hypothetical protein FKM82_025223 [Ascaphus truei]
MAIITENSCRNTRIRILHTFNKITVVCFSQSIAVPKQTTAQKIIIMPLFCILRPLSSRSFVVGLHS